MDRWTGRHAVMKATQKGRSKSKWTIKRNDFVQKQKKKPSIKRQAKRKGILRSQQRGSAALRIMSQKKLQEMFLVK